MKTTITFINKKAERRQAIEQGCQFLNLKLCTAFIKVTVVYFSDFYKM